jgi:hypothetical protein
MLVAPGPARPRFDQAHPGEAVLLEALAAAGEALTHAIVHRDLDAIVAATHEAELLVERLTPRSAKAPDAADRAERSDDGAPPDPSVLVLGAQISSTARRNAFLLERAWATDAALLRLMAGAAKAEAEAASCSGTSAYAAPSTDPARPSGWLDRSA